MNRIAYVLAAIVALTALVVALAAMAALCYVIGFLVSIDDPFRPMAPDYQYEASITGLKDFSTDSGQATVMLPLPGVNGLPVLAGGWWVNYSPAFTEKRHGMLSLGPANNSVGLMLEARIIKTDYYIKYPRTTPVAGNESSIPGADHMSVYKPLSFDDVYVIASGSIQQLDYPSGPYGISAVRKFLAAPLLPVVLASGESMAIGDYTSLVYIDPALKPLEDNSSIHVKVTLTVKLNHNKVNASEEGKRSFEFHTYTIDDSIPGGKTGYIPVRLHYSYRTGVS